MVAALAAAVAAFVFFVAGLAELQRPPFDMPVADSEIIFGAYTEYTGLRFALFLLAEYAGIVVLCCAHHVLFLGGWRGPFGDVLGLALDAAQGVCAVVRGDLAAGVATRGCVRTSCSGSPGWARSRSRCCSSRLTGVVSGAVSSRAPGSRPRQGPGGDVARR